MSSLDFEKAKVLMEDLNLDEKDITSIEKIIEPILGELPKEIADEIFNKINNFIKDHPNFNQEEFLTWAQENINFNTLLELQNKISKDEKRLNKLQDIIINNFL